MHARAAGSQARGLQLSDTNTNSPGTAQNRLEFKGEAFNVLNTPSFFPGDININSTTFDRLSSVNVDARVIQLSVRFDF